MVFCGWLYGRDEIMRNPYAHYNEMFYTGVPTPLPDLSQKLDLSVRISPQEKSARVKARRVRNFEIACTMVAGEMFASKALL